MTSDVISSEIYLKVNANHKKHVKSLIIAGVVFSLYIVATFLHFDLANIAKKWNSDRAAMFILDTYAHKDHITMKWKNPEKIDVRFEGGYRHVYKKDPEWLSRNTTSKSTVVNFDNGGKFIFFSNRIEMKDWPDVKENFIFKINSNGKPYVEGYQGKEDLLPNWMRATESKVEVRPSLYERLQVYGSKVEVHRYELGWKYFWFDFDSPLSGKGFLDGISLMFSDQRVDPLKSNFNLVINEFLENEIWHHNTVLFAMVETLLMAILGTFIASIFGLPLAFMAAYNVTPFASLRFFLRRIFDLLRGIDMLIWSLIFLRAFGPGLFTGIFAIAFTDTGTLGKLMSEAIENTDKKEKEGIQSTGANKTLQHRFGIIPQILPIFISQSLYYLESNTRAAVIIGAMGAGGIGLHFLGALMTGNDFENVGYMALLVLIAVMLIDTLSSRLRRFLIGIEEKK